jgi:type I restriction enzyme, R subunit
MQSFLLMNIITEDEIEQIALDILNNDLGYETLFGPDFVECDTPERTYAEVVLSQRLQAAIDRINPNIPTEAREEAYKKALRAASIDASSNNETFHVMLTDGIDVKFRTSTGTRSDKVWLIDYKNPHQNNFLAVNQFTVIENNINKRADVVLFINGLPIVVIELKNATDEDADMYAAYQQLQTYKVTIPSLFQYNCFMIASDGWFAKAGTISSDYSRFMEWKTADGEHIIDTSREPELEPMLKGMLNKENLLDIIRYFIVFEKGKDKTIKKIAAYHQYYAVNKAVQSTLIAAGLKPTSPTAENSPPQEGCPEGGVVRNTQNYFSLPYNPALKQRARELRQAGNLSEVLLWNQLKNKQFKGYDFDRQKIIGNYIVDFYCTNCNVVIEIDGSSHDDKVEYDKERDKFLESLGLTVIHIPVVEVLQNMDGVMKMLRGHKGLKRGGHRTAGGPPRPSGTPPEEGNENSHYPEKGERQLEGNLNSQKHFGSRRVGVIWHTQGSGKSLSMVFYTGKMVVEPAMNNPTIVVLTDRNDLDDQLFGTFCDCQQLLRQEPKQATDRKTLRALLAVASGGIVFTTIQKFLPEEKGDTFPMLTDRRNVVVVADEAHRSQYDFIDGFARHMRDALPNASFIGFTGTPIEKQDASTQAVFGDYIDVYDIEQAVKDGATVRIFYESRLAKIRLSDADKAIMDQQVEEITEDEELTDKQKRFAKWASKEAVVGSDSRLRQVAKDMVAHFELRTKASKGKAMFVAMSRRIAVELHDEIIKLRPDWYSKDDDKGSIKVIMTGSSSDGPEWAEHIRNKKKRTDIGNRLKDPDDELKIVIVRDMWLTGFDAPVLHTLYIDKPMSGHNLMQAIARINRVFGDKQGGLVVDYIGIAQNLKKALAIYTESKGKGQLTHDINEAAAKMMELYEVVVGMFATFDYKAYFGQTARQKMQFVLDAANYILDLTEVDEHGNITRNGKQRFKDHVTRLSQAFALSVTHPDSKLIRDDLAFFQAIKARIAKFDENKRKRSNQEIETALRQIVNDAIISDEVIDIYDAAGIKKPDISILDDKFLAEVKNLPQKNLALELLKRLLEDEVKSKARNNISQSKKFSVLLDAAVKRYQSGLIEAAQVIDELIKMAQEMREAANRGQQMNLREDELAFYDALAENPTAETILGDATLKAIAHELVESVRRNTSIDWQLKESVQAKMRTLIKRILRKYKYPPDDPATGEYTTSVNKVLSQAELLADYWAHIV